MTRSLEAQSQPQPHELDEASSSRIEMAMHVAAPITTRPSPPRAVHITAPSSSLIHSAPSSSSTRSCIGDDGSMPAQSGNNNSNAPSGNTTTTTTSMKSRRVPPPKITPQDEALHNEPAATSCSSLDHGKDQFAALLALGVAQQQAQQQHILLQNAHRPTLNTNISNASSSTTTTASSSSTLQAPLHTSTSTNTSRVNPSLSAFPTSTTSSASSGTGTGPYTVLGNTNLLSIPTSQTKQATALEPGPSNSTHMQGATPSSESSTSCLNEAHPHRQNDVSNNPHMNHLPSPSTTAGQTVYQRPDRSDSTVSLLVNDTEQDHPSGAMNVLQHHRMNAVPAQNQSHHILSLNSRSTSSSSSHSSNNTPSNEYTSHSYTSNTASGSSTGGGGGGKKLANILAAKWNNTAHNAVNKIQSSMIASTPISDSNGQDYNQSKGVTNSDVNSNTTGMGESATEFNQRLFNSERRPPLVSASSSNSNSSTTTTSTSTTKASHGAISKFSARLRDVAHNISSSSSHSSSGGKDTRSQGHSIEEVSNPGMYSPSASSVAESTTTTMGGGGGAGSNTGMSKSSSLRSLSAFGNSLNSLKTKKFTPSFPNSGSSTSLASTLESPPSSTLIQAAVDSQSQHMSSGNASLTGGIRKITGFTHRSNPSTSSSSFSNAFNTLRNNSPLSSISSSLSSSNSGSSSSNPSSTSNMLSSNRRHHGSNQSISIGGGNRSVSMPVAANSIHTHGKMKNVLGVQIPMGRAGEVFGAPLNVAADRTRLIGLDGTGDDESERMGEESILKGIGELDEEGLNRRKEACMFLPAIAIRCLDYLNEYGKTEEGLYRIPGSTLQVSNLRLIFDSGKDLDLLENLSIRILEPSAVASLFKLWLRELPESLLHNMEREIDILLLEHTGNAASSKVTMAQAQSPSPSPNNFTTTSASTSSEEFAAQQQQQPRRPSQNAAMASPLVINRIKELFADHVPRENVILLREISYHLAHLASFSNVTKMTFSNLRLILSPTLRLSPVMLSLLVNEREQIFPKPGTFLAAHLNSEALGIRFNSSNLDLSLPLRSSSGSGSTGSQQPKLTLSLPGEDALPPIPPSKSPIVRPGQSGASSSSPPTVQLRTPFSSNDSSWTSLSSPLSSGQPSSATSTKRRSNGSMPGYRASWHVVDFPPVGSASGRKSGSDSEDEGLESVGAGGGGGGAGHINTPIARKFLHQRASLGNLLDEKVGSTSPSPSESSRRSVSSNSTGGSNVLTRTPTLTGRSPSPFFSSGAPPAALGFMATHSRKRSSASSFSSIVSNSVGVDGRAMWRARKVSPPTQQQQDSPPKVETQHQQQDEEEELSHSDTNTSICSSASSAKTPIDQHDSLASNDAEVIIAGTDSSASSRNAEEEAEEGDSSGVMLDSRRATITAESFTQSFARRGQGKNANSEEMRRKRGSMMILNMPSFG